MFALQQPHTWHHDKVVFLPVDSCVSADASDKQGSEYRTVDRQTSKEPAKGFITVCCIAGNTYAVPPDYVQAVTRTLYHQTMFR